MTDKSNEGIRVFVYGTLKAGHGNHLALVEGGAKYRGRAHIEGNIALRDLGWYPCVCDRPEGDDTVQKVYGEVYLVDEETLHTLDCIEGHPNYYQRRKVQTEEFKNVWVYFLPSAYADRGEDAGQCWQPSGEEQEFIDDAEAA